jgi:REP element-mobilizing transposase RayT
MQQNAVATSGRWTAVRSCCIIQVLYSCEHVHLIWLIEQRLAPLVRVGRLKWLETNCLSKLM